jgi:hypothetical protein
VNRRALAGSAAASHIRAMNNSIRSTFVRAWLTIAVVDWIFASTLGVVAYHSTVARVWQGVASVVLGRSALQGGLRTVLVGTALHLCVAFTWTAVFLGLALFSDRLRRFIATPIGVMAASIVYGPLVWITMSTLIIPTATGRPPTIGARWWAQIVAHMFFVALPIVAMVARGLGATATRHAALEPAS